ncbi:MAG: carbon-nitrogen hydrolase family protein [Actinomycetia bacterium]|nr:carbon-nitrogen hydrolase family protein [Actinomycetes bacterium]
MIRIAAAQDSPVYLDASATTERAVGWIEEAATQSVSILAFGETFLPGYPFWLSETGGAEFESDVQKQAYAAYVEAAVTVDGTEVAELCATSNATGVAVIIGIAERSTSRGSVYATALVIDPERGVLGAHRKLVPTYEERLVWAAGDGHGLRVHTLAGIRVSVLNCWENWMPLARHALYAQGTQLHVGIWPGSITNTRDITRFVAREGRVYMLSASTVLHHTDLDPGRFELLDRIDDRASTGGWISDGGSAIASPDGNWVVEPVVEERRLVVGEIDPDFAMGERQNFDPAGHYGRPDVFDVRIDRTRREPATFSEE